MKIIRQELLKGGVAYVLCCDFLMKEPKIYFAKITKIICLKQIYFNIISVNYFYLLKVK